MVLASKLSRVVHWPGEAATRITFNSSRKMSEVSVVASVQVKPGQVEQFLEVFQANVPHVLAEDGCLEYAPAVDVDSGMAAQELAPEVVTILERWASLDALNKHAAAPHTLAYREQVKGIVEGVSLKVLRKV